MVIDIHPHIISTDTVRYPNAPLGGNKSNWSNEHPISVDEMIAAMDAAGIAKSALVQASTCYGHDNSYVADAVAAHPDRFTGVFSVDVLAPDAPEKIRYWVNRKLTGMRLFTAGSTMSQTNWVDDPRSFPAWETAGELGALLLEARLVTGAQPFRHVARNSPMPSLIRLCLALALTAAPLLAQPIGHGNPYAIEAHLGVTGPSAAALPHDGDVAHQRVAGRVERLRALL